MCQESRSPPFSNNTEFQLTGHAVYPAAEQTPVTTLHLLPAISTDIPQEKGEEGEVTLSGCIAGTSAYSTAGGRNRTIRTQVAQAGGGKTEQRSTLAAASGETISTILQKADLILLVFVVKDEKSFSYRHVKKPDEQTIPYHLSSLC